MPEPTSSTAAAVATLTAAGISMPMLTLFGVPLGLRVDLMIAGFCGSLVAIILLNSVPGGADTWLELLRTTVRRMSVALASSITAGYLTPLSLLIANLPDALLLSAAFAVGGGAQRVLIGAIARLSGAPVPPKPEGGA